MKKKGLNLFRAHPELLYSRGFGMIEPMCCEVCKFCFFHIGSLICRYRKATYKEWLEDVIIRGKKK